MSNRDVHILDMKLVLSQIASLILLSVCLFSFCCQKQQIIPAAMTLVNWGILTLSTCV